jgi:hypothetical protein
MVLLELPGSDVKMRRPGRRPVHTLPALKWRKLAEQDLRELPSVRGITPAVKATRRKSACWARSGATSNF